MSDGPTHLYLLQHGGYSASFCGLIVDNYTNAPQAVDCKNCLRKMKRQGMALSEYQEGLSRPARDNP